MGTATLLISSLLSLSQGIGWKEREESKLHTEVAVPERPMTGRTEDSLTRGGTFTRIAF